MTMIDMTVPGMRESVALRVIISRLSLVVGTQMTWRDSTLNAAKRNGFTVAGTNHGALLDCIGLARVLDPEYQPDVNTVVESLTRKLGQEKAEKKIAQALRRGDQFRALLAASDEDNPPIWRGVAYAYK